MLHWAMTATWRNLLAFVLGCTAVALGFWGVLQGVKLHHLLPLLGLPAGAVLLLAAFRISLSESTPGARDADR